MIWMDQFYEDQSNHCSNIVELAMLKTEDDGWLVGQFFFTCQKSQFRQNFGYLMSKFVKILVFFGQHFRIRSKFVKILVFLVNILELGQNLSKFWF